MKRAVGAMLLCLCLLLPGCGKRQVKYIAADLTEERRFSLRSGELSCVGTLNSPEQGLFILKFGEPEAMREFTFKGTSRAVEVTAGSVLNSVPLSEVPPDSPISLAFAALTALVAGPLPAKRNADGSFTLLPDVAGQSVSATVAADGSPLFMQAGDLYIAFSNNKE